MQRRVAIWSGGSLDEGDGPVVVLVVHAHVTREGLMRAWPDLVERGLPGEADIQLFYSQLGNETNELVLGRTWLGLADRLPDLIGLAGTLFLPEPGPGQATRGQVTPDQVEATRRLDDAISRFNQTDFQSKTAKHAAATRILAAAKRHDIEVDPESDVAKAAKA